MAAATELLGELGIPARIAAASRDWLEQLAAESRTADYRSDGSRSSA